MPTPPRKPTPRTSRPAAPRPRRVAGSPAGREPAIEPTTEPAIESTERPDRSERSESTRTVERTSVEPVPVEPMPVEPAPVEQERVEPALGEHEPVEPGPRRRGVSVLTAVLSVVIVLLLALGGVEIWYLARGHDNGSTVTSATRPVVVSDLTARSVVDQAARDADTILSVSYQDFDQQVAKAAATMTPAFAAQFTKTKADIKQQFVAQKAVVTTEISNQGVVNASPDQVIALLFLTETTQRTTGTTSSQFRVLVTMTHSGSSWLVSDLKAE